MGADDLSYSQVSAHNTREDCWIIINAKVYDVTKFLIDHPGGDDVLLAAAGQDASQEFEDVGHGSAARLMLDEFYVGEIDSSSKLKPETMSASSDFVKTPLGGSTKNYWPFNYFIILAIAIMVMALGMSFLNLSR